MLEYLVSSPRLLSRGWDVLYPPILNLCGSICRSDPATRCWRRLRPATPCSTGTRSAAARSAGTVSRTRRWSDSWPAARTASRRSAQRRASRPSCSHMLQTRKYLESTKIAGPRFSFRIPESFRGCQKHRCLVQCVGTTKWCKRSGARGVVMDDHH